MQIEITDFSAYIPIFRIKNIVIGEMWGKTVGPGEKDVANWEKKMYRDQS